MQTPLQIAFEGIGHSKTIEARIREEAKKLDNMDEHITSVRVVVAKPSKRHYTGDPYQIRIHLMVPGGADINVNHDPRAGKRHDDMKVAIQDAFRAAHRQLEDMLRKRQGHVKTHEAAPRGVVKSLFQDHGFIAAPDEREVYFHRNSVAAREFDGLSIGERVSFSEETGDKGQQATFVRPLRKHTAD
jgi:cold shock CspA family protein